MNSPTTHEIRCARISAGHTQGQSASMVAVTTRAWQNWEAGKHAMPAATWALYRMFTKK